MHIEGLICSLCHSLFRDPVTTKLCRHHFCRICLEDRLEKEDSSQCPTCNKTIEKNGYKSDASLLKLMIKVNPASAREAAKNGDAAAVSRQFCDSNEMVSFVLEYFSVPMTVELVSDDDYEEQDDLDGPSSSSQPVKRKKKSRKFPSPMDTIFRRYYRCPAKTPLAVFQRLLQEKLSCSDSFSIHFVHNKVNKEIGSDATLRSLATETGWLRTRPLRLMFTIIPARDRPPLLEPEAMPCLMAEAPHETPTAPKLDQSPSFVSPVPALTVSISTDRNGNQAPRITAQNSLQHPRAVPRRRLSDPKSSPAAASATEKSPPFNGASVPTSRPILVHQQPQFLSPQMVQQGQFRLSQQQVQNMLQQRYMHQHQQQQMSQQQSRAAEDANKRDAATSHADKRGAVTSQPAMVRAYPNLVATLQPNTSSASSPQGPLFPVSIVPQQQKSAPAAPRLMPVPPPLPRSAGKARTPPADLKKTPIAIKRPADSSPIGPQKKVIKTDPSESSKMTSSSHDFSKMTPSAQTPPPSLKMANVKTEPESSVPTKATPLAPPLSHTQKTGQRTSDTNESTAPSPPSPAPSQPNGPLSVPRPNSSATACGTPSPPCISPMPRADAMTSQSGSTRTNSGPQMDARLQAMLNARREEKPLAPRPQMTSPPAADGNSSIDIGTIAKMTGQRLGKTLKDSFLRPKSTAMEGIKTFHTGDGLQFRIASDTLEQLKKTKILAEPVSSS